MSRKIDPTKPLSEDDIAYLRDRPWKYAELGLEPVVDDVIESDDDSEPGAGQAEMGLDYNDLSKNELATLAHSRGLAKSGTKDELIARLTEADNATDEDELEDEDGEGEGDEA